MKTKHWPKKEKSQNSRKEIKEKEERKKKGNHGYDTRTVRSGMGYGTHGYDTRTNGRAWLAVDNLNGRTWLAFDGKYRGRSGYFGYGNELNRGLRAKGGKNQKGF